MTAISRAAAARPYSMGRRNFYGALWTFYTAVCVIAAFASIGKSVGAFFALGVIAAVCGRYAYRIWTFRARRLLFLLIF